MSETENNHDEIPQVKDRMPLVRGLLPKNAQARVLSGVALVMVLVILFSGHNAPKETAAKAVLPGTAAIDPNQGRIQEYRQLLEVETQKLAAQETELARTKQAFSIETTGGGAPGASVPGVSGTGRGMSQPMSPYRAEPERNWIDVDREKRDYQGLYASNIALSYRQAVSEILTAPPPTSPPTSAKASPVAAKDGNHNQPETGTGQYRPFEGTVLETVLTNRLDGSFSGPVNALVTTNVYASDHQTLLVPQGTRALGEVRKVESAGQQRLAVVFHRLIMPDGYSISLDQYHGLSQAGETGLRDQIDHHYLQIFGVSLAIGAIAGLSQANTRYGIDESAADAYRQGMAASLSQSSLNILDRFLNVLPTFTIREGHRIKIYLAQDLTLPAYDHHPAAD